MTKIKSGTFSFLILLFIISCGIDKKAYTIETENIQDFFAWTEDRIPMISAHRGGPVLHFPENCLETFENTISQTHSLIEMDVQLSKDYHLVLMHDDKVDRTTNGTGKVQDLTFEELRGLRLKDNEGNLTSFIIPTFKEALNWCHKKTILSVDIKKGVPFEKVVGEIVEARAEDRVFIITYNLQDAMEIYKLNPRLMISVTIRSMQEWQRLKDTDIPASNVVAFIGLFMPDEELLKTLHQNKIYCILGTIGNLDKMAEARGNQVYANFVKKGADILATDSPVEAGKAIIDFSASSSKKHFFKK